MAISKKKRIVLICVIVVAALLLIGGGIAVGYVVHLQNLLNHQELDPTDLGISDTWKDDQSTEITNIALFGVDRRGETERTRSDTIIILTVDKQHNKIKMTSLMRDTYVAIEGHGNTKLTHAYYYGGPQLAVKTINQNFNMAITEYATVNFQQMATIIDAVGGVEIDISEAERQNANQQIKEQAQNAGMQEDYIEQAGLQTLNGVQAVAYARIRYVGNADFERTSRQRIVLNELFNKALAMNMTQYPAFVKQLLPCVETSLSFNEIMDLATIMTRDVSTEELRLPQNNHLIGSGSIKDSSGGSCLYVDLEKASACLHTFIYDDILPENPSK